LNLIQMLSYLEKQARLTLTPKMLCIVSNAFDIRMTNLV